MLRFGWQRRRDSVEDALKIQAKFLEALVNATRAISVPAEQAEILQCAARESARLFEASSELLEGEQALETAASIKERSMLVPLTVHGKTVAAIRLTRDRPFDRLDLIRATVLADFAVRAYENARLLLEARIREAERGRLSDQLVTAEQDERRRLSIFLHDGPIQSMSGIALMHDVALATLREGKIEEAATIIENSLGRERDTIRILRDLSFAIEPLVLRDQGFAAAVGGLAEQIERSHHITVLANVEAGDQLADKIQVALYQIIREALNQAVRRVPGRIDVTVVAGDDGGFVAEVSDDGVVERRRASIEQLHERVRILNGRLSVEHGDDRGTLVRVLIPPYMATAGDGSRP